MDASIKRPKLRLSGGFRENDEPSL